MEYSNKGSSTGIVTSPIVRVISIDENGARRTEVLQRVGTCLFEADGSLFNHGQNQDESELSGHKATVNSQNIWGGIGVFLVCLVRNNEGIMIDGWVQNRFPQCL